MLITAAFPSPYERPRGASCDRRIKPLVAPIKRYIGVQRTAELFAFITHSPEIILGIISFGRRVRLDSKIEEKVEAIQNPKMPEYKLTYFNVKGLGEPIRFILTYGGADFQDNRIDRLKSWPNVKPSMPYGQVPVLEIDGKIYHQSLPICRYLAKQFNIGGKTDLEALEIDAIANTIFDFRKSLAVHYWEKDPIEKAKKREAIVNQSLPFYMKRFDDLVTNNGGYFHAGELSYADLLFAAIYDHMNALLGLDVLQDYPNLKKLTEKVYSLTKIAAYIAKRPKTDI